MATIGGNVLQRPRCWYYRLESYKCVKKGGDVCFAVAGENRYNVIFGGGPAFPTHPSSAAVPLVAYDASFVLDGPKGVVGREHVKLRASSPTAQYWCSHTTTVMGPDDVPWSPEACQPHRGCFETE